VLIKWGLQRYGPDGLVSIPKSANPTRVAANLEGGNEAWQLGEEDLALVGGLESNFRYFCSYLKKPDNEVRWHDGVTEQGTDADFIA